MQTWVRSSLPVVALLSLFVLAGCSLTEQSENAPSVQATVTPIVVTVVVTAIPTIEPTKAVTLHAITGTVTILNASARLPNPGETGSCMTGSSYDDIKDGSQVVVKNGNGQTLAIAAIGTIEVADVEATQGGGMILSCTATFTLRSVPDAEFYVFSIGRRDGPTYSFSDMTASRWAVRLTLGP